MMELGFLLSGIKIFTILGCEQVRNEEKLPRICLVSSSGGHYEQLKLLIPLIDKYQGFIVTEKNKVVADEANYLLFQTDLKDKLMIPKMIWNTFYTIKIWLKERPDFIVTTGTLVAYPFYILAIMFNKKFIFIETFGRADQPTIAGKMMEKHSGLFLVQWKTQAKYYKKAKYGGVLY